MWLTLIVVPTTTPHRTCPSARDLRLNHVSDILTGGSAVGTSQQWLVQTSEAEGQPYSHSYRHQASLPHTVSVKVFPTLALPSQAGDEPGMRGASPRWCSMPPPNAAAGALTRVATRRPFAAPATAIAAAEAGEDRGSLGGTDSDEAMASRARRAAHLLGSPRARA
jgi:hypothetical protein